MPEAEWHHVSGNPPEQGVRVLVMQSDEAPRVAWRDGSSWMTDAGPYAGTPAHWRPLTEGGQ